MDLLKLTTRPVRRAAIEARSLAALVRAGAFGAEPPRRQLQILRALRDYGPMGAAPRIAALRHPELPAIADERGTLSFAELDEQVDRLANALKDRGLVAGSSVGILCRNHRAPLITAFAASRAGVNAIWLNTAFSARQAAEVAEREGVDLLVFDEELSGAADGIEARHGRIPCAADVAGELDRAIEQGDASPLPRPARPGRVVLLTSGTTGTPKGAPRPEPRSLSIPGALLERMPMRAREGTVIGPPLYHGTGLIMALLSVSLGSRIVLRTRFDPAGLLADTERHRATAWCVVPIMLQRLLALGEDEIRRHDLS
ncbi:MAG: fatty-acyl-CoA synthase, partial [Solirubrobacteraceae bacterium]|nr:fatty-acyl-CoA synthase [Solirubrobacteraceae bacterium]